MDSNLILFANNLLWMGAVGAVVLDDSRVRKTLERYTNLDVALNAPEVK